MVRSFTSSCRSFLAIGFLRPFGLRKLPMNKVVDIIKLPLGLSMLESIVCSSGQVRPGGAQALGGGGC